MKTAENSSVWGGQIYGGPDKWAKQNRRCIPGVEFPRVAPRVNIIASIFPDTQTLGKLPVGSADTDFMLCNGFHPPTLKSHCSFNQI